MAAAVVWAVSGTLWSAAQELRAARLSVDVPLAVAGAAVYLVAFLPMALFWRRVLRAWGQPSAWAPVLRAYYLGHVGKYVPGKAMVVVLRAGALASHGGRAGTIAVGVFVETLTMMAVGGALAGVLLALTGLGEGQSPWLAPLAACLSLAAAAPSAPPLMNRLVTWYEARRGDAPTPTPQRYSWRLFGLGWLLGVATWCGLAASLWILTRATDAAFALTPHNALACLLAATLPVVAGFLSLIPGGLVVRDGLMVALLAPAAGAQTALAATVLARVTWVAAEALVCGILVVSARRGPPPSPSDRSPRAPHSP